MMKSDEQRPSWLRDAEPSAGVEGFVFYGGRAGIKKSGADDFGLIFAPEGARCAAVYTQNLVVAAPVTLSRAHLKAASGRVSAVLVNSGNANACTGEGGMRDALESCQLVAQALSERAGRELPLEELQVCSTGVIGAPLPMEPLREHIPIAAQGLTTRGLPDLARAIMTTDTRPKARALSLTLSSGVELRVAGVSKGAGMIHPNMATMLAYLCTDASLSHEQLNALWSRVCDKSFNAITIDGDTSTNDTALLLASGQGEPLEGEDLARLERGLTELARELALDILRDGEGVEHVLHLKVSGARSQEEARRVAEAIALSPLVKTALNGCDPNWGRIIAAAGRSGVALDPSLLSLSIGGSLIYQEGRWQGPESEAEAHEVMRRAEYEAELSLGLGSEELWIYGTDLSADYVRINADYRS
jgi:glutamate N-acetyltransferase/amino-acid N-acetyltransferase